jgi:TusA-related sulfurtransferase
MPEDPPWSSAPAWTAPHQAWSREVVGDLAGEGAILVDLRGGRCPAPVLGTRRALARYPAGQALVLLADDPQAATDVPAALRLLGQALIATIPCGGDVAFVLRRAPGSGAAL